MKKKINKMFENASLKLEKVKNHECVKLLTFI